MSLDISRVRSERLRGTHSADRAYSHEVKLIREPQRNRSSEVLQLCRHPMVGWQDAPPGIFGLWSVQVAPI